MALDASHHAFLCYGHHVGEEIGIGTEAWFEAFGDKALKLREAAEMDSPECDTHCESKRVRADKVKEIEGNKMRVHLVEPVVGWASAKLLVCTSGTCGICRTCEPPEERVLLPSAGAAQKDEIARLR